ncbi:MAG: hypothetical protein M3011_09215, partial [Actinomycetota bacterium]|nr:hypothetical protein [Actinomycetota bacterium]
MIAGTILTRPEVLGSSILVLGAAILALRMTTSRRGLSRFKRPKAAVPVVAGGAETPFQVGKTDD